MRVKSLLLVSVLPFVVAAGCSDGSHRGREAINPAPWPMHPIDSRFRGANGLGTADVDGDGFTDYLTNYEFDQRYEIAFHPGPEGRVREPWPTVTVFVPDPLEKTEDGVNPESADLGDLDGDGFIDVVTGQGWGELPFWEGSQPGVRIVWGPARERARYASAWHDAGIIPGTAERGHFHFVRTYDVNGDGATDIVAGGRVHGGNGARAGVRWIEAPGDPAARRDLGQWAVHEIDPEQLSGHGFVFVDVDDDGDDDLALANADFDTPEEEERLVWYENPGTGRAAQREPWPMHEIDRRSDFDGKPQVAFGDLDGDGLVDLAVSTRENILFYRKTGTNPVFFERITIPKDPRARYFTRPLRIVDIDADGQADLFGMLVHENSTIPYDLAAAFWMEWEGDAPGADNWTTHVIKWGSGQTMFLPTLGEKWDQVDLVDVDGDGDLDIVADCEEWWEDGGRVVKFWESLGLSTVAVVWFENRMFEAPYRYAERGGSVVIEAENFSDSHDGSWLERARFAGYGGHGYVIDHNSVETRSREWSETGGLEYVVDLGGGTYHVSVRRWIPSGWGTLGLGGTASDSAWIGVDGAPVASVAEGGEQDAWGWARVGTVELVPGEHVVQLRVREGGFAVDRLLLSTDADLVP